MAYEHAHGGAAELVVRRERPAGRNQKRGKEKMKKKLLIGLATGVFLVGITTMINAATIFLDGNFAQSDWSQTVNTYGAGGTQTVSQQSSGGNPGNYLYVNDTVNHAPSAGTWSGVWGTFLKDGAIYDPSLSGAVGTINYAEDAIMFSGFGEGQASYLVIQQAGNLYFNYPYFTTNYGNWTHLNRNGLTANDFGLFDTVTFDVNFSLNPNFSSSGSIMAFGFGRANSTSNGANGYTILGGIDNWQVTINPSQPVPEPATMLLFGTGIAGLAGSRLRRRKNQN